MQLSSEEIKSSLATAIAADRVLIRPIDLIAYASDASFYRLIPKAVVQAQSVEEIRALFAFSQQTHIPMTFRAAGTSLSGQAVSDGLLVEVARNWRELRVEEGGRKIRVQPGVIGARANLALAPYGAKIGPDPASIATCTIGGILSNNSSGMCCGVEQNAYHTLNSMKFMLPSGTIIDTSQPDADEEFHAREPQLARGMLELKARMEREFRLARARTQQVPDEEHHRLFAECIPRLRPRGRHLPARADRFRRHAGVHCRSGAEYRPRSAGEIHRPAAVPRSVCGRGVDRAVAAGRRQGAGDHGSRLVALGGNQSGVPRFDSFAARRRRRIAGGVPIRRRRRAHGAGEDCRRSGWRISTCSSRRGSPTLPANRLCCGRFGPACSRRLVRYARAGTTVIIEDVAFPVESLADAAHDLTGLFRQHGYDNAIIFGHAKDGNLHFVITQSFNNQAAIDQYKRFIDDVVKLVVERYDGALKAEHGTGRNMAPFVETEWGSDGYEIMRRLKQLADPHNLLNPGVIINRDREAHLANLKQLPSVEPEIDKCIECGYCEPKCPSRELTLTPRQRIVVRREMARLQEKKDSDAPPFSPGFGERVGSKELYEALDREFPYMALHTCATDGLCATACPVSIDTGQLVKRFRNARASAGAHEWAARIAKNFALTERVLRWSLRLGHATKKVIGVGGMIALTRVMKRFAGGNLREWMPDTPYAAGPIPKTQRAGARAVYFPSCISRVMGRLPGEPKDSSLMEVTVEVARACGTSGFHPR